MDQVFKEGDIVVGNDLGFIPEDFEYDYAAWTRTRMLVVSVEDLKQALWVQAIDERPDRDWILRNQRASLKDPQDVVMYWPIEKIKLAS